MSSKFNVRVSQCSGAVVVGDNASLTVGAPVRGGKCGDFNYLFSSSDSDVFGFHSGKERVAVGRDGYEDSSNHSQLVIITMDVCQVYLNKYTKPVFAFFQKYCHGGKCWAQTLAIMSQSRRH